MRMQFVSYVRESLFQYIFTKCISNFVCVCVCLRKQTAQNFSQLHRNSKSAFLQYRVLISDIGAAARLNRPAPVSLSHVVSFPSYETGLDVRLVSL